MKVHHDAGLDYLTIDFADEIEAKSIYENGIIVRYGESGNVVGIDITDSMKLFSKSDLMSLREVCDYLGVSESTIRRRVRAGKIKHVKEGNRYCFRKADIINMPRRQRPSGQQAT